MTDTAQPTPEQMDRARRIADDMHPVKPGHHVKSLLNNVAYKAALTAILAADQQHAEAVRKIRNEAEERIVGVLKREAATQSRHDEVKDGLIKTIGELRQQQAELMRALEPFALVAQHDIGEDEADHDLHRHMDKHNRAPRLTVGDFRRAFREWQGGNRA